MSTYIAQTDEIKLQLQSILIAKKNLTKTTNAKHAITKHLTE